MHLNYFLKEHYRYSKAYSILHYSLGAGSRGKHWGIIQVPFKIQKLFNIGQY